MTWKNGNLSGRKNWKLRMTQQRLKDELQLIVKKFNFVSGDRRRIVYCTKGNLVLNDQSQSQRIRSHTIRPLHAISCNSYLTMKISTIPLVQINNGTEVQRCKNLQRHE
jgi:hypothetical protein